MKVNEIIYELSQDQIVIVEYIRLFKEGKEIEVRENERDVPEFGTIFPVIPYSRFWGAVTEGDMSPHITKIAPLKNSLGKPDIEADQAIICLSYAKYPAKIIFTSSFRRQFVYDVIATGRTWDVYETELKVGLPWIPIGLVAGGIILASSSRLKKKY